MYNLYSYRMCVVDMALSSMCSKTFMLSFLAKSLTTIKMLPMALCMCVLSGGNYSNDYIIIISYTS